MKRADFLKLLGFSPLTFNLASWDSSQAEKVKPAALPDNPLVGLIAPASPIYQSEDFNKMVKSLKALGFRLKAGESVQKQFGYLAGIDSARADDLNSMFRDPEIDAILCIRGGYGSNRILGLIDYDLISENPKVFAGFSDITAIHMAIHKLIGLTTFHSPVGKSEWNAFSEKEFRSVIQQGQKHTYRVPDTKQVHCKTINSGSVRAKLLGGNLSVLCSLIGSDYLPDFNASILFIEEVGEDIYRIDRLFSQLKLSGILDQISGFIFGECLACEQNANSLSLEQVLDHYIKPLEIPAFYGAMISHDLLNTTVPIGIQAEMNSDNHTFRLLETAVQ